MIDDPEEFAQDLRTIADRIEDGEYEVTAMSLRKPGESGEPKGEFAMELYTTEEFERMAKVFHEASTDA